jgi:hypothetical protein
MAGGAGWGAVNDPAAVAPRTSFCWSLASYVPRFASFDTSSLRSASSAGRLPWLGRSVTLLRVDSTGVVQQAKTDSDEKPTTREPRPDASGALTGSGVTVAQHVRRRSSAYRFSLIGLTGCAGRCPVGIRADSLTCLNSERSR